MSDKALRALDLLPTAKDLLKRGMWPQAEVLYRHIVEKDPEQAEALNDLGIARACQGALDEAAGFARQAVALDEDSPIFRVNLARHLFQLDRIDDAEAEVYAALALDCRHEAAIEALDLMQNRRKRAIDELVAIEPVAETLSEPEVAVEPAREPEPESESEPEPELEAEPVEAVKPKPVAVIARKKVAAPYRGKLRGSEEPEQPAETQDQQLAMAYKLFSERDYEAVLSTLRTLEADHPGHPLSALWTSLSHFRLDDLKRARRWADQAVERAPKDHAPQLARGLILQAQLEFEQAEEALRAGIELAPKNADFHSALAFQKLLTGDWPEGWQVFDKVNQAMTKQRLGSADPWKGERLGDDRLHLWALEGVGDFLMMARVLPELENRASNMTIECDARLIPLLKRSLKSGDVVGLRPRTNGKILPTLGDVQSTDRGVIRHLSPDLQPGELETAFLQVDQDRTKDLRKSYQGRFPGQLLVGVSWFTTSPTQGRARSVLPSSLEPLLDQSHCQFIDLQYRDPSQPMADYELGNGQIFRDETIDSRDDFDGLAAQMSALDLVVTIDNSTAQLAGALGVPAWVLLHQLPDWRWGLRGDASAWYPSLRLFRQSSHGDWSDVIEQVCRKLKAAGDGEPWRRTA